MKQICAILFITLICSSAFAQQRVHNVAVVETMIDEASGADKDINKAEVREITNEIRSGAINHLPRSNFNIMTTETVLSMGDAVLQECAEENCVIALGSKIGADYIVRGTISKFRQTLTLTVEIFDTEYGMLLATGIVRTANLDEMLEKTTAACAEMYRKFLDGLAQAEQAKAERKAAREAAASTPTPPPPPPPVPAPAAAPPPPPKPAAYTLTTSAAPAKGGSVTRNPSRTRYDAGAKVTVTATPARGYRFDGWGTPDSKDSVMTVTMNNDLSLTANFSVVPKPPKPPKPIAEKPPKEKGKSSPLKLTVRWSGAALAVGGIIGGIAFDGMAKSEYEDRKPAKSNNELQEIKNDVESLTSTRDLLYILGGVGAGMFTITLFF